MPDKCMHCDVAPATEGIYCVDCASDYALCNEIYMAVADIETANRLEGEVFARLQNLREELRACENETPQEYPEGLKI